MVASGERMSGNEVAIVGDIGSSCQTNVAFCAAGVRDYGSWFGAQRAFLEERDDSTHGHGQVVEIGIGVDGTIISKHMIDLVDDAKVECPVESILICVPGCDFRAQIVLPECKCE